MQERYLRGRQRITLLSISRRIPMKLSIALILVSAAVLSACSRPVVRETVVERPVYVPTPAPAAGGTTVVTPSGPAPAAPTIVNPPAAAAGSTSATCTYQSQIYSHGSLACQDRTEFRCNNGVWNRTMTAC